MVTVARTAYEYTTSVLTFGFMGAGKGKIKRQALHEDLARMGADGWELVHVWWNSSIDGEKDGHLLIYRRPA